MRVATALGALTTAAGLATASGQKSFGKYDYVIVGGGLTGLVTAARLTEDPKVSVLVLEYGTIDRSNVSQIPYYGTVLNTAGLRSIMSAPEPHLNNRTYAVRASQLAGGGSQVNGMQWDLPSGADFDACRFEHCIRHSQHILILV
jgi:choline dehydrogenase-like flavoprotein